MTTSFPTQCLGEHLGASPAIARMNGRHVGGVHVFDAAFRPRTRLLRHDHAHARFSFMLAGSIGEVFDDASVRCERDTFSFHPPAVPHGNEIWTDGARALLIEVCGDDSSDLVNRTSAAAFATSFARRPRNIAGKRVHTTQIRSRTRISCVSILAPMKSSIVIAVLLSFASAAYAALDTTDFDSTTSPCVDFNEYANGGWIKKNPIPAAFPAWGATNQLRERNRDVLRSIVEAAAADRSAAPGSNEQKIGDYYASCMDESLINRSGIKPLEPELARIAAVQSVKELQLEIARLHTLGFGVLFEFGSDQDRQNSSEVIAAVSQRGLGMPEPEYYLKDDAKSKDIREAYRAYVQKVLELAGDNAALAANEANAELAFETRLAKSSMSRADRRDPDMNYHRMTLKQASAAMPHFDWALLYKTAGVAPSIDVNVATPEFFKEVDRDLAAVPLADWKNFLRFHYIAGMTAALPQPFVDASFAFYSAKLRGATEQLPRWKRCVAATDNALGEALGQEYVKRAFPPEAKARTITMVDNLTDALRNDISSVDWMSDTTKKAALEKLQAITRKIGYPDKWQDYSALAIDRGAYASNEQRVRAFDFNYDMKKIGRPVDRGEWDMTPPTVNAYYFPPLNEIVFAAGILQPPFFDPTRDDAYNYGATGATIGHELTHAFDNSGAKFDAHGNQVNWWTADDLTKFQNRAACIVQQFDAFAVGDVHENGRLVSGESIADLAGLKIALAAYLASQQGRAPQIVDGFTPEQRVFIGYAQGWAGSMRPEYERYLATANEHPLDRFRVNAPLSNMPEFATAFHCNAGDPMVRPPDKRCVIW